MIQEKVSFEQLAGITGCLALALAAHVTSLPPWLLLTAAACGAIRILQSHRGRDAPPRGVLFVIALASMSMLILRFRTLNGLLPGTALLALAAGLKLLETRTRRDIYVITLIIYFLSLSALLYAESFWLLAYLIAVCWLTTATLLRLTTTQPVPEWRPSLRYGARVLLQALPLALVFWLLFPRFAAPLWQLGGASTSAGSGLSDSMSPGDITQLALSDEVAFRVHFAGQAPPPRERYWRGPVLHDFDGRTWRGSDPVTTGLAPLQPEGAAYTYTVNLEPHEHNWIFTLDWPSQWDLPHSALTGDYTLMQRFPVSRPLDVTATSYTHARLRASLSPRERRSDTVLPPKANPRTLQLSRQIRADHPDDRGYANAVLAMFSRQAFYYTLTPPPLADNSVDDFLFETKRGFCGHYASAFAALMRAAGIPARVVTGYHGGEFNRFANYWIVRQSSAHAWNEIWIEGEGWIRVDPTSAIAPERVEHSVNDAVAADAPLADHWQRQTPWMIDARLRLDAMRELWRERILTFNQDSQQRMLQFLRIPEPDGQKLVLLLAGALALGLCWLTWQVRRELDPEPADKAARAYARLCRKLQAAGLPRRPHEGAETYAARVSRRRPDLAVELTRLCRQYSSLRYETPAPGPIHAAVRRFAAAVRAFRVSRS